MSRRPALTPWLVPSLALLLGLAGCKGSYGGVKINVTLVADAKTQCLRGWVTTPDRKSFSSDPVARTGDHYVIGVAGSEELVGDLTVGVDLFASADCSGGQYASTTDHVVLERGKVTTVNLTFDFSEHPDGGTDGGLDDGGMDGGTCMPSMCTTPPICHTTPGTCGASGCEYPLLMEGSDCGDGGVCNAAGQCGSNVCLFRDAGAPCDDGLACTTDTCIAGNTCFGACAPHPFALCNTRVVPTMCGADGGCAWTPSNRNGVCSPDGGAATGRCNTTGWCDPWFVTPPSNLPDDVTALPLPTQGWTASAGADGGPCVIDTSGATPGPRDPTANCGFTGQAMTLAQDGGEELAVFLATELLVPPGVEVRFVGTRPAVLAIFGDATVYGTMSAAAATGDEAPAGAPFGACPDAGVVEPRQGGTGGSYRTTGGTPGVNGVVQATNGTDTAIPLRAGCAGREGGPDGGLVGIGGVGGQAGGALQLSAMGVLTIGDGGVLSASGAGGLGGGGRDTGGGGGGSGGTLLLEGRVVQLINSVLTANGGAGGQGGRDAVTGQNGADGSRTTNTPAVGGDLGSTAGGHGGDGAVNSSAGGNGVGSGGEGGGGAGAGVGLIRINSFEPCVKSNELRSGEKKSANPTCN